MPADKHGPHIIVGRNLRNGCVASSIIDRHTDYHRPCIRKADAYRRRYECYRLVATVDRANNTHQAQA